MKAFFIKGLVTTLLVLTNALVFSQATYPAPHALSSGAYQFLSWPATSAAGTFPSNAIFHRATVNEPALANFVSGSNYALAYNLTTGTRIIGEGDNGFSFINTGTNGNLGAFVLALNATGEVDLSVSFKAGLLALGNGNPTPRDYRLRMQYSLGNTDEWFDLATPLEYNASGQLLNSEVAFDNIALPSACNNQPLVYLRWVYFQQAANDGGTRPRIRLDDIVVSSQPLNCTLPTQAAANFAASNIGATSATLQWTNGNGNRRLVILREGAPVSDLPANGTSYLANAAFGTVNTALGTGFVVFNGVGSSVTVSGLTLGNTYHAVVVEFRCMPELYLTTQILSGSFTTVAAPSLAANPSTPITLTAPQGFAGSPQSFALSGSNLINEVTLSTNSPFELSLSSAGPFGSSLTLSPISGLLVPTDVFVRFFPQQAGTQNGNINISSSGANAIVIDLIGNVTVGGTFPAPFALCSGNYQMTEWPADATPGSYPANMAFHRMNANDPSITASDASNYMEAYNGTAGTRINGLGTDGFSFINTGTAGNLGQAVLGINTLNRTNVTVSFVAGLITQGNGNPSPRNYGIRFQYRIGGGNWNDLPVVTLYQSEGKANGDSQNFSNLLLPTACENQPLVYLRWLYYQIAANDAGSRPRMRVGNIQVQSQPALPPSTDGVAIANSETAILPSEAVMEINTVEDGFQVWAFALRDGGETGDEDNFPTLISAITIGNGPEDEIGNFVRAIGQASLFDGAIKLGDATIDAFGLHFTNLAITIPDNGEKTFTLRISPGITGLIDDNAYMQFKLNHTDIVIADPCNSSVCAEFEIVSNPLANRWLVEATQLIFIQAPPFVGLNQPFLLSVAATDEFANIDKAPRSIVFGFSTGTQGALSTSVGLGPHALFDGVFTVNDFAFSAVGNFSVEAEVVGNADISGAIDLECFDFTSIDALNSSAWHFFPNPAIHQLIFSEAISGSVFNLMGKQMLTFSKTQILDVSALPQGVYLLMSERGHQRRFVKQ